LQKRTKSRGDLFLRPAKRRYHRLVSAAQPKSVPAPRPKRRATKTEGKPVAPAKPVMGAKPKRKTKLVASTKRTPKRKRSEPTKRAPKKRLPAPTNAVPKRTAKRVPTKPVSKAKAKPVAARKPVPKPETKPVAPAKPKPKAKPVSIAALTKGPKTKTVGAAAKAPVPQAKTSAAKPTLVAGPGFRCLANHRLRRRATGRLYCAICDR
jgi:hypothetical protein